MKLPLFLTALIVLGLILTGSFLAYTEDVLDHKDNISFIAGNSQNEAKNEEIQHPEGNVNIEKQIKVDLSQQKAFLFESGVLVKEFVISGGLADTPTPVGEFKVVYKQEQLYSKIAKCDLSYWVGFTNDGLYGFHETPVCNGIRDGEEEIGNPASHGCVRLKVGDAQYLYNWAEINTLVKIY